MRRPRSSRLYLAASLALAISAGVLTHMYVSGTSAAVAGPYAQIVVAAHPIDRGTRIMPQQLRLTRVPSAYVQAGTIHRIPKAAGRVALTDLLEGEAVTETRLARVRAGPVASLIPEGLRAFAVPTSLPEGALEPGDHVDVLATYSSGQPHTEAVVSGVEVLFVLNSGSASGTTGPVDVGRDAAAAGASGSTTLILLVSTEEQERLAFARAFADLSVSVASPQDTGV